MTDNQDNDQFLKWRCLVALAHADGKVTQEEVDLLRAQFGTSDLTPAQIEILEEDLEKAQDPAALFSKIASEAERTDVIHRGHLLFWSDGEFAESEKRIFDILKEKAREGYTAQRGFDITKKTEQKPGPVHELLRVLGFKFSGLKKILGK